MLALGPHSIVLLQIWRKGKKALTLNLLYGYVPMRRGFVYLAAVIDWFTRKVLAWRVSITLETVFCIEAVEDAMAHHGKPEIFNTDQGSQFTSIDYIKLLKDAGISISMDGKGAWRDNVFIERYWRSIKYEEIYLHAYSSVPEARAGIGKHIKFYNQRRPHSSLAENTPDQAYFNQPKPIPLSQTRNSKSRLINFLIALSMQTMVR